MTLLGKINSVFKRFSDRDAFIIDNIHYTYGDFARRVAAIKQILIDYSDEENIGIVIRNDIETYASLLAILFAGKTYIPINPNHPHDRTSKIIGQSRLKVMLGRPSELVFEGIEILDYTKQWQQDGIPELELPNIDQNRNAYILFTSGSTGIPKGVQITHRNLVSFVNACENLGYKIDENDRFLQMFDLTFDLSVFSYLVPLCYGSCVCTVSEHGIKYTNVYKVLAAHDVTVALMVPSTLNHLRPYFDEIYLPHIRHCLFCGEALYKDITLEWIKCVPNGVVDNVYGPTEATVFCLAYNIIKDPSLVLASNEIVSIGKPMQKMDAIVVDEHLSELPDGEKGELCLSGDQLTPGYLDEEKNQIAFFNHNGKRFYRTGDLAAKVPDGNFVFSGRKDHQVKIQGHRVELSEIEFHLRRLTGGSNAVALAVPGANGMIQIEVIFEDCPFSKEVILDDLKSYLPDYMIPIEMHFINPFPLNANGKTDKLALAKLITR